MTDDDPKRVEELERRIQALESLVSELARASGAKPATPATSYGPPNPARKPVDFGDAPVVHRSKRDWESIIGRYGTLALATVSVLAAVGTFIGWAVSKGWLGPTPRVGLGLLTAAVLAVAGLRIRRTERSFGSSLLGLSLAVVHVCAWGAGPTLHLVPPAVAFAVAALASAALALLARFEEDEPLWCVGFAGAVLAPFVTSSDSGNMPALAAYGAVVLVASGRALGSLTWPTAGRLFGFGATLYVGTLMLGNERNDGPLLALALPLVVAFVGVLPWYSGMLRRDRLRPLGALAAFAALRLGTAGILSDEPLDQILQALKLAAGGIAWLALVDISAVMPSPDEKAVKRADNDWIDAALVPAGFTVAILTALPNDSQVYGLALAASAAALLATVARHRVGTLRDAAVAATAAAAIGAATQLFDGSALTTTAAVAVTGAACFAANLWRPSRSWEGSGSLALGWSMLAAAGLLSERAPYLYTPFGTKESALGATVLAAIVVSWRMLGEEQPPKLLKGGMVVWAFAWIHQEIVFAINPTVATLLRVSFYAVTSVAAVWVGRARSVAILRHVGLGLAVLAAGTALYSARELTSIGARIVADLVAAGFLLAIAFWYRKPGITAQPVDAPAPQATSG